MEESAVGSLVGKVVDLLFVVAIKEIGYMWNCTRNVENFQNEVGKLKDMKGRIQEKKIIAEKNGDVLLYGVKEWVGKADDEVSKAEAFLEKEGNAIKMRFKKGGVYRNWKTLHHYGKIMATKMTPILQLQKVGSTYERYGISMHTPPPGRIEAYQMKNIDGLVTHYAILGDIIKSLENVDIQIIGIYGLGGVGKTTLAMEAMKATKEKNLFDEIVFTTVTKSVDADKIQKDTEKARKKIGQGKKVLIILDEVWEILNLEELCIPCGINHKNCKILLTSRSEEVCEKMNVQRKICVSPLPIEEAWILFKRVVGEVETDAVLNPVAKELAKECGGLPLLIQVVGNALKTKRINLWSVALSKLKKHALSEIDPDIKKAFIRLKLSYDYLESEEAKTCFLLCSLFTKDDDINLEDLVHYGVGLRKFDDLDSMEDARGRVQNAVSILTSSSLLLNVRNYEEVTKMHDVDRHVALLAASEGKNKYLVKVGEGLTEWLPRDDNLKDYTGISLMYNKISKLPDYEVPLSSLDIFLVNKNPNLTMISDEFIKGIREVKVLDLSECPKTQLPQSLKLLTKLRMLNLQGNKSFYDISLLGEMKELEILILNKTVIKEIPKEIGQLVNLRRLEVSGCRYMTRVTPGVISKLERLEELFIEFSQVSEGVYECLVEVMKLWKLTYLDLMLNGFDHIPEGFISQKLKGILIQIGGDYRFKPYLKTTSILEYCLYRFENLNNIMPDVYYRGVNKVENIYLKECPNVSCLVDDSTSCDWYEVKTKEKLFTQLKHLELGVLDKLEVLWKCRDEYVTLTNLVTLSIYSCDKLVRVFTVGVAQGLVSLKYLEIENCDGLEEVIWGGETKEIVVFPQLAKISLNYLLSLKCFFNSKVGNGNCSIFKYPSLVHVKLELCGNMKIWGTGIHITPNLKTLVVNHDNVQVQDKVQDATNAINKAVEKYWRM